MERKKSDLVADMIWWLSGFDCGIRGGDAKPLFIPGPDHIEALYRAKLMFEIEEDKNAN